MKTDRQAELDLMIRKNPIKLTGLGMKPLEEWRDDALHRIMAVGSAVMEKKIH